MSRSIDERVVKMTFDNKQFEQNVAITMDTLTKFQTKVAKLSAGTALQDMNKQAQKVDLTSVAKAVDEVTMKFDAMTVVATTALAKITNQAIETGKNMVKSLSFDQLSAGFQKYTDKTSAVSTIMSATGKSIEEVSRALEKLQWFTDETSYNFTDMVNNIAKFTNNKVPLDQAISAIMGIAMVAADASAYADEASRAMYNFSQAIATGSVKLIDWKSIENANMATVRFKDTLIDAALAAGTLIQTEEGIVTAGKETVVSATDFNSALAEGWLNTQVLNDALGEFSAYANKIYEVSDAFDTCTEAMEATSAEGMELGETAFKAGQEAKTFTDAISATKDAVSSGWMQTFEIVFGDYEEAVELWSGLTEILWDAFASGAEGRNQVLTDSLMDGWKRVAQDFGSDMDVMTGAITDLYHQTRWWGDLVTRLGSNNIEDIFHAGAISADQMYAAISKVANAHEGLNEEEIATSEYTAEVVERFKGLKAAIDDGSVSLEAIRDKLTNMSGRENIIAGLTDILRVLNEVIQPLKNAINEIFPPITAQRIYQVTQTFKEFVASLKLSEEAAYTLQQIFKVLLIPVKLLTTAFQVAGAAVLAFIYLAWRLGDALLTLPAKYNLLELLFKRVFGNERYAVIMENLTEVVENLSKGFDLLKDTLAKVWKNIKTSALDALVEGFKGLKNDLAPIASSFLDNVVENFKKLGQIDFSAMFERVSVVLTNIGRIMKQFFTWMKSGATTIYDFIKSIDFKDPIKSIKEIGEAIKEAFENFDERFGLTDAFEQSGTSLETFKEIVSSFIETLKQMVSQLTPSRVMILAFGIAITAAIFALATAIGNVGDAFDYISDFFSSMNGLAKAVKKQFFLNTFAEVAKALVLVIAAVGVLSEMNLRDVYSAVGAVALLSVVLGALTAALTLIETKLLKTPDMIKGLQQVALAMFEAAGSILVIAAAMYVLSQIRPSRILTAIAGLTVVILEFVAAAIALSAAKVKFEKGALFLLSFAASIAMIVMSLERLANADVKNIRNIFGELTVVIGLLAGLALAASNVTFGTASGVTLLIFDIILFLNLLNNIAKFDMGPILQALPKVLAILGLMFGIGLILDALDPAIKDVSKAFLYIALALDLITLALAGLSGFTPDQIAQGTLALATIIAMFGVFGFLMRTLPDEKRIKAMGSTLLTMSASFILLDIAITLLGALSITQITQGTLAIAAIMSLFGLVMYLSKGTAMNVPTLLLFVAAIGILTTALTLISLLPWESVLGAAVSLSIVLLALGGSLKLLANPAFATSGLRNAMAVVIMLGSYVGAVAVIFYLMGKLSNTDNAMLNAIAVSTLLLAIGGCFKLLSSATFSTSSTRDAVLTIGELIVLLGGVIGIIALLKGVNAMDMMPNILVISGMMLGIAGVIKLISGMTFAPTVVKDVLVRVGLVAGIIAGAIGLLYLLEDMHIENAQANGIALGAAVGGIGIALIAIEKITVPSSGGTIDWKTIAVKMGEAAVVLVAAGAALAILDQVIPGDDPKGLIAKATAIGLVMLAISASVFITNKVGIEEWAKAKGKVAQIIAFAATGGAVLYTIDKYVPGNDPNGLIAKATAMGLVMLEVAGCVTLINSKLVTARTIEESKGKLYQLIGFAVAGIGVIAVLAAIQTDFPSLIGKTVAFGLVVLELAAAVTLINSKIVTASTVEQAKSKLLELVSFAGAGLALLTILNIIDADVMALIGKTVAFGILVNTLASAVMLLNLTITRPEEVKDAGGKLAELWSFAVTGGILLVAIAHLTGGNGAGDVAALIGKTVAFGLVVAALAGAVLVLNLSISSSRTIEDAGGKALELITFAASAGIIVSTISDWEVNGSWETLLAQCAGIGLIMVALAGLTILINNFMLPASFEETLKRMAALAGFAIALGGAADILAELVNSGQFDSLISKKDVWIALGVAMAVITLEVMAMGALFYAIGGISGLLPQILSGMLTFFVVLGVIGLVIATIGALDIFAGGGLADAVANGGEVLRNLGSAIGGFFGGLIGGLVGGFKAGELQQIASSGDTLADFATTIQPFMDLCTAYEEGLATKCNDFIGMLEKLAAINPPMTTDNWVPFAEDIAAAAPMLGSFVRTIMNTGASAEMLSSVSALVDSVVEFEKCVDSIGPIGNAFSGWKKDATQDFADRMAIFGQGMHDFLVKIQGLDTSMVDGVVAITETLANLEQNLPSTNAFIDFITGRQHLDTFGDKVAQFGTGLRAFCKDMQEIGESTGGFDIVQTALTTAQALSDFEKQLDPDGGFGSLWFGERSLSEFATKVRDFGSGLRLFVMDMAYVHEKTSTFDVAAEAVNLASALAEIEGSLTTQGGLFGMLFGDSDIGDFGKGIGELGNGLMAFTNAVQTLDENLDIELAAMTDTGELFGNAFAEGIGTMVDTMQDEGHRCVELFVQGMKDREQQLKTEAQMLAKYVTEDFVDEARRRMYTGGEDVILGVNEGMHSGDAQNSVMDSIGKFATDILKRFNLDLLIQSPSKKFEESGKNIVLGIKEGIDNPEARNTLLGSIGQCANNLVNKFKELLQIESPSRVTKDEVGRYIVEGIAYGITEDMSAEEAAKKKADNIVSAFQEEFDRISRARSQYQRDRELYENLHIDMTDYEKAQRSREEIQKNAEYTLQELQTAKATLIALQQNDPTDTRIQEWEEKVAEYELKLSDYAKQIAESNRELIGATGTRQEQYKQYVDYMLANEEAMSKLINEQGFDRDEVIALFQKKSGVDPAIYGEAVQNTVETALESTDPQVIFDNWMDNTEVKAAIAEDMENAIIPSVQAAASSDGVSKASKVAGATIANDMMEGFSLNMPTFEMPTLDTGLDLESLTSGIFGEGGNPISNFLENLEDGKFDGTFSNLMGTWATDLSSGIQDIGSKLIGGLKELVNNVLSMFGISSPSKLFMWIAEMCCKGFEKGLINGSEGAETAFMRIFEAPIEGVDMEELQKTFANLWKPLAPDVSDADYIEGATDNLGSEIGENSTPIFASLGEVLGTTMIESIAEQLENGGGTIQQALTAAIQGATKNVGGTIATTKIPGISSRKVDTKVNGEKFVWWDNWEAGDSAHSAFGNVWSQEEYDELLHNMSEDMMDAALREAPASKFSYDILEEMKRRENEASTTGEHTVIGDTININQNISSPTPVDATTVYRSTRSAVAELGTHYLSNNQTAYTKPHT